MHIRFLVAAFGALALLVTACGSEGGTGATSQTTVVISPPDFITITPVESTTTTTAPAVSTVPGEAPVGTVPGEQSYTVEAGDALFVIAQKHCMTGGDAAETIANYNKWSDGTSHQLQPGDTVLIPPGACVNGGSLEGETAATDTVSEGGAGTAASDGPTTTADPSVGGTYVINDGDTLSGIASKTGTTVDAIVAVNGWEDENHVIYAGMEIKLPAKS